MVIVEIGGVKCRLKEYHNFDWLGCIGEVFCVFDQQDSGNLGFGVQTNHGKKLFVKYAGAKTTDYSGEPSQAVSLLKRAVKTYEDLKHPSLVELVDHYEVDEGYVALFDWFTGECLHSHGTFPPPAKYHHPDSPYFRFKQLSLRQRLDALDVIYSFHVYVEDRHYVAVDFYDGSILYDFNTDTTKICDVDYYQPRPFVNMMGRLWGSSRFMSPEEVELGAQINEQTNVFNMGAAAFALLGGELNRSLSYWEAGRALYDVAERAVEKDRSKRFTSVKDFYVAWTEARNASL